MALGVVLSFVDEFSKPLSDLQKSVSGVTKSFNSADTSKLAKGIAEVESKIKGQNRLKFKLTKELQDSTKEANELYKKLKVVSSREKELNSQKLALKKELKDGKIDANRFNAELKKIDNSVSSLNSERLRLNDELESVRSRASKAEQNINRVDSAIGKLNNKKLRLKQEFSDAQKEIEQANSKLNSFSLKLAKISAVSAGIGKMALGKIGSFVGDFKEIQKAQGDIASLSVNESGIAKITKEAKELADTYSGMVAPDIIRASYDIKSGIASLSDDGVAYYTKLAATTAKATISTTKEMTKLFALTHGIFKGGNENDIDFGKRVASSIAQAVKSFRTDGSDLVQGISNIGATAHAMGVSLEQELAIVGNAKDAFSSAAEAGTGYRAFLAGAVGAQKTLGISLVDTKGKLLPMAQVLERIKKKFGSLDATEMAKLKKAFGSEEAVKIITALIDKTDKLKNSEQELLDAKLQNVEAMAKARNRGGEFILMLQRLSNLASTVGQVVAPVFDFIANGIGDMAIELSNFIGNNELAQWAVMGVTGLAALATILGVVGLGVSAFTALVAFSGRSLALLGFISKSVSIAMAVFKGVAMGVGGVLEVLAIAARFAGSAVFGLVRILLFSPIGVIVAGIAAAAYLIIDNWSTLVSFFSSLWESISSVFVIGANFIVNLFTHPIEAISSLWAGLGEWFGGFWVWLGDLFSSGIAFISNLFTHPIKTISSLWAGLANWFGGFWQYISSTFNKGATYVANIFTAPIAWIRKMWGKLLAWISEKINAIKGIVNKVASFVGHGKVFDIDINAKGDIGTTTGYKDGTFSGIGDFGVFKGLDNIGGSGTGNSMGSLETIKALKDIGNNTKPLHKIAQGAQKVTPAPLKIDKKKNKKVHGGKSGVKHHAKAGGSTKSPSIQSSSRGTSSSRSGGNNYNINITLSGTNESLVSKLESLLPAIIKDIEADNIGRAMYDS